LALKPRVAALRGVRTGLLYQDVCAWAGVSDSNRMKKTFK
jgi:hypothetical protein